MTILDAPVWILTWKRPDKVNRIISQLAAEKFTNINVLSSAPTVEIYDEHKDAPYLKNVVINTLNDNDSNAWCARNWNTCFLKALKTHDSVMCFQDDTGTQLGFGEWLIEQTGKYDFLWGPAGDQWFYLTRSVLATVGYWDERYLSCWCGDADMVRRVYQTYDKNRISVEDTHPWGFQHNPCGISKMVAEGDVRPWRDKNHVNQHQEMEAKGLDKVILKYCIDWYFTKWGQDVYTPINTSPAKCQMVEPDWYPWFTRDYLHRPEIGPAYKKAGGRWEGLTFYPQEQQPDGSWKELSDEVRGKTLFRKCDGC